MDILKADGFEAALIGLGQIQKSSRCELRTVYDHDKCVKILVDRDGMTWETALDYMAFNVMCSFVSDNMPVFVTPMTMEELDRRVDAIVSRGTST